MMNEIKGFLKKYNIHPLYYKKYKSVVVVKDKNNTYAIKKRSNNSRNLYKYLRSRSFNYYPEVLNESSDDNYDIFKFYEDFSVPKEERAEDLIGMTSMLHVKTTHYENTTLDDYKKEYEKLAKELDNLSDFYNDLNNLIDEEIYMSPSEYLLVRNISKIYSAINFCSNELDEWYDEVKDTTRKRVVLNNNNLELDHLIKGDRSTLISWDKAYYSSPIYDLYNFYKKEYKNIDFEYLLDLYEKRYPLSDDERRLLFILISIPEKVSFQNDEFVSVRNVNDVLDYVYKTEKIISKYYSDTKNDE